MTGAVSALRKGPQIPFEPGELASRFSNGFNARRFAKTENAEHMPGGVKEYAFVVTIQGQSPTRPRDQSTAIST